MGSGKVLGEVRLGGKVSLTPRPLIGEDRPRDGAWQGPSVPQVETPLTTSGHNNVKFKSELCCN